MVKREKKKNEALTSYQLKMLKLAYEPYQNEAYTQLIAWIIVCLFTVGMSILCVYYDYFGNFALCIITLIGLVCAIYRIWRNFIRYLIYPSIEIRFHKCICAELQIVRIRFDNTMIKRYGGNIMPDLYDKKQDVDRYKFICLDSKGKKVVLRAAISYKRKDSLFDALEKTNPLPCSVTYGKFTHIIWHFDNKKDQWADYYNHTF